MDLVEIERSRDRLAAEASAGKRGAVEKLAAVERTLAEAGSIRSEPLLQNAAAPSWNVSAPSVMPTRRGGPPASRW